MYTPDEKMTKKRWDHIYTKGNRLDIDESIPKIVALFKEANVSRVLDLGCGSGRHTIYLAEKGFNVYGIDISDVGVKTARSWLHKAGLHAVLMTGSIVELLYEDNFFDGIICVKVLHHGRIESIQKAIKEMERVLKPGGVIFVTVRKPVPKDDWRVSRKIAPRTYVPVEGKEKDVVHYLFNEKLLRKEFKNFFIHELWVDSHGYYCLFGELKE